MAPPVGMHVYSSTLNHNGILSVFETLLPMGFSHYLIGGLVIGIAVSLFFITTGLIGGDEYLFYQYSVADI